MKYRLCRKWVLNVQWERKMAYELSESRIISSENREWIKIAELFFLLSPRSLNHVHLPSK